MEEDHHEESEHDEEQESEYDTESDSEHLPTANTDPEDEMTFLPSVHFSRWLYMVVGGGRLFPLLVTTQNEVNNCSKVTLDGR